MTESRRQRRPASGAAWCVLAILASWILSPFLSAIAWSCVLAHATWPVHARIARWLPGGRTSHAIVSTCLITSASIVPLIMLALSVRGDLAAAISWVDAHLDRDVASILDSVARIPLIGPAIHDWFAGQALELTSVRDLLQQWAAQVARWLLLVLGDIGRNLARFGLTVCFLFLLYAHGDRVVAAVRTAAQRAIGDEADHWLDVCAQANRAVVVSMLLAALVQGIVASVGYWLVGLQTPVLLGLATAVASLLPLVGTLLVWGPASVFLLSNGQAWPALALVAWGSFLIHPTDNILRPWLVSGAVRLPFLLVFLGVVGGLACTGLIGIVLGPMVLAVAWDAIRKELVSEP
jgi:predicted PurR-regulated permease PerM